MKKIIFVLFVVAVTGFLNSSNAQAYRTALGVRLSSSAPAVNNSISLKHFLNNKLAVEGLFSFGDPVALGVSAGSAQAPFL